MTETRTVRKSRLCAGLAALVASCALAAPASAQLLGGGGGLPLPNGELLRGLPRTIDPVTRGLDTTLNRTVQTIDTVVRDTVGRPPDPHGHALARAPDGARIVRNEILAIAPRQAGLAAARNLGFAVMRQDRLGSLGLTDAVLRPPEGMGAAAALAALRKADPTGSYDYNHVYDPSGDDETASAAAPQGEGARGVSMIGMIDAGIDTSHPVFEGAQIERKTFAGHKTGPATAHGTAVASLLIGNDGNFHGMLRGTTLYAADVYGGRPAGGSAEDIARALAWLASEGVPVVNISLSGPSDALLAAATKAFLARGHVLVAAVGNEGPAAPMLYPAAYPGVVGVTSVDVARHIQIDANQGADVAFAARGVHVRAAVLKHRFASETGTSFAAPVVAARFALLMPKAGAVLEAHAWKTLEGEAIDLGTPGRDPVFGYGYLGRPPAALAARAAN